MCPCARAHTCPTGLVCLLYLRLLLFTPEGGGREGGRVGTGGRQATRLHLNTEITTMPAPDKQAQRAASHPPSQARPNDPRARRAWVGRVCGMMNFTIPTFSVFLTPGRRWGRMLDYVGKQMSFGKLEILFLCVVCVETSLWLAVGWRAVRETERHCVHVISCRLGMNVFYTHLTYYTGGG